MLKRSLTLSILAIGLVGVACPSRTSDVDDGGEDGGGTITIDNLMDHYVTVQCEHEIRCASDRDFGHYRLSGSDQLHHLFAYSSPPGASSSV